MFKYSVHEVARMANEANFNRNVVEKVLRLYSVLDYIGKSSIRDMLVLKGGTAINLFLLDLPRLSVDIDFDFCLPLSKEEMLEKRKDIDKTIRRFMSSEGYALSDSSKFTHSLDSYVYSYETVTQGRDTLKIEINYSNRVHILDSIIKPSTNKLNEIVKINRLCDEELIGSKINALLLRTTPRDIYDVYELYKNEKVKNVALIRKIAIFYVCIGSKETIDFDTIFDNAVNKINNLSFQKVKETLIPMLQKGIVFDTEEMKAYVSNKLKQLFILDETDIRFISEFNNKNYLPGLLFEENDKLLNHPMAIWKMNS